MKPSSKPSKTILRGLATVCAATLMATATLAQQNTFIWDNASEAALNLGYGFDPANPSDAKPQVFSNLSTEWDTPEGAAVIRIDVNELTSTYQYNSLTTFSASLQARTSFVRGQASFNSRSSKSVYQNTRTFYVYYYKDFGLESLVNKNLYTRQNIKAPGATSGTFRLQYTLATDASKVFTSNPLPYNSSVNQIQNELNKFVQQGAGLVNTRVTPKQPGALMNSLDGLDIRFQSNKNGEASTPLVLIPGSPAPQNIELTDPNNPNALEASNVTPWITDFVTVPQTLPKTFGPQIAVARQMACGVIAKIEYSYKSEKEADSFRAALSASFGNGRVSVDASFSSAVTTALQNGKATISVESFGGSGILQFPTNPNDPTDTGPLLDYAQWNQKIMDYLNTFNRSTSVPIRYQMMRASTLMAGANDGIFSDDVNSKIEDAYERYIELSSKESSLRDALANRIEKYPYMSDTQAIQFEQLASDCQAQKRRTWDYAQRLLKNPTTAGSLPVDVPLPSNHLMVIDTQIAGCFSETRDNQPVWRVRYLVTGGNNFRPGLYVSDPSNPWPDGSKEYGTFEWVTQAYETMNLVQRSGSQCLYEVFVPRDTRWYPAGQQFKFLLRDSNGTKILSEEHPIVATPPKAAPQIMSLGVPNGKVVSGNSFALDISLDKIATQDTPVGLDTQSSAFILPTFLNVEAGHTKVRANVNTRPVAQSYVRSITATVNGHSQTVSVTLVPSGLRNLVLSVGTVKGGATVLGQVHLNGPRSVDTVVHIQEDSSALDCPKQVVIYAGSLYANFPITTTRVGQTYTRRIVASFGGINSQAQIVLTP